MRTHYQNLRVSENAEPEVIKAAYKALAQKWHPDRNPDDTEKSERYFKIITHAYEVLSNPESRHAYDDYLANTRLHRKAQSTPYKNRQEKKSYKDSFHEQHSSTANLEVEARSYKMQNRCAALISTFSFILSLFLLSKGDGVTALFSFFIIFIFLGTWMLLLLDKNAPPALINSLIVSFFITSWLALGGFALIPLPFFIPKLIGLTVFNEVSALMIFLLYLPTFMLFVVTYVFSIYWLSKKTGLLPKDTPFKSIMKRFFMYEIKETPVKETPVKETPVKETPVKETPLQLAVTLSLIAYSIAFCATFYEDHGVFFSTRLFEHGAVFSGYLASALGGSLVFPSLHVGIASFFKSKRNPSSRRNIFIGWSAILILIHLSSIIT